MKRLAIDDHSIHVISIALDAAAPGLDSETWTLSALERERAGRFLRQRDGRRFSAAHSAMRRSLAAALGIPAAALEINARNDGKPWLPRHPELGFNLSHSGPVALLAIGRNLHLGIDIEHRDRLADANFDWRAIAQSYFTERERQEIGAGAGAAQRFLQVWTAKEAVLKAIGSGLSELDRVEIALAASAPLLLSSHSRHWCLTKLTIAGGHPAALAHDGSPRPICYWRWDDSPQSQLIEENLSYVQAA